MSEKKKLPYADWFHPNILPSTWHFTETDAYMIDAGGLPTWISVKDRLPKEDERVLVTFLDEDLRRIFICGYYLINSNTGTIFWGCDGDCPYYNDPLVDHWMPILPLPEEKIQ